MLVHKLRSAAPKRLFWYKAVFLSLLIANEGHSQSSVSGLPNLIQAPPNASSLGRVGQTEVSNYTGIPNISQPLAHLREGSLSLDIGLNYRASGVKVMDQASWVGLNWSLEAGGAITRTVRGLPDEHPRGFLGALTPGGHTWGQTINNNLRLQNSHFDDYATFEMLKKMTDGYYDSEPDEFAYNFNGRAGRLFIDGGGNVKTNPLSDLDIKLAKHGGGFALPSRTATATSICSKPRKPPIG